MKSVSLLLFLCCLAAFAQQGMVNQVQYGATLKAKIEFNAHPKNEPMVNFRISSGLGIAGKWMAAEIYPSVNAELQLYNGGIGSRSLPDKRYANFDAVLAFTMTAGHISDNLYYPDRDFSKNIPLKYFGDFAIPALQNPYTYSASLGTNLIWSTDKGRVFQRVGFLNLHHGRVQLSYYNDGTPFQLFLLGDYFDRFYTAGGVLSYGGNFADIDNLRSYSFEASYHKFTGFSQSAFEAANVLNTSLVDYVNPSQMNYNKSVWKIGFQSADSRKGFGVAASFYNSVFVDGQHRIHTWINNSFHYVPYEEYINIEPSVFVTTNELK